MKIKNYQNTICIAIVIVLAMFAYANQQSTWPEKELESANNPARQIKNASETSTGPIPANTMTRMQQTISEREYHITLDKAIGKQQSPNRRHNLRAYYEPGKLSVKNRADSAGHNFKLTLTNAGIYADGHKLEVSARDNATSVLDNTIRIKRGAYTEEYKNSESGIRQNFIIHTAPSKTKNLQVRLTANGLKVKDQGHNKLAFYDKDRNGLTGNFLTYNSLKCWDANGKQLEASLAFQDNQIVIDVNASNAAYPVTIDPIIANGNPGNANSVLISPQADSKFGSSVSSAGDVNGDGYSDVIIGAPDYDENQVNQGAFFLFTGSSSGLISYSISYLGDAVKDLHFASSLSPAGDINGDGYSDVVAGCKFDGNGNWVNGINIFYGSAQGLDPTSVRIESSQANSLFGSSVAGAGDINGDGYSDIVVGASKFHVQGSDDDGAAFIFLGSAAGIATTAAETLSMESPNAPGRFGSSVASAGDVDGDGYSDIIIGSEQFSDLALSPYVGAAFIYHGSPSGLANLPSVSIRGNAGSSYFANSVSAAGDLNGDGFGDIIIGSSQYESGQEDEGAAFIYYGEVAGINPSNVTVIESNEKDSFMGFKVACAGDVNGDGYSDVLISAAKNARIYHGSKHGVNKTVQSTIYGCDMLASAGDVNGDGFSDIVVGSPWYNQASHDGIALVFHGSSGSVATSPTTQLNGNQHGADLGFSVSDAGDVNGDGLDDIIVGAPFFDNGAANEGVAFLYYGDQGGAGTTPGSSLLIDLNQADAHFGWSVSSAGDVNGDGYDDVIIGAHRFDILGMIDAGAGFVYYGSSGGLSLTNPTMVYMSKAGSRAGTSVRSAGDVNGDGFADVVVGAPLYANGQNDEGAIMISMGSATGIKPGAGLVIEGGLVNTEFGNAVSGAGDVNGDGFGDVIVGADHFENAFVTVNEGAAFVYYGSKTGIKSNRNTRLELNQAGALFGYAVSKAGDVNGDGFDDIVIGANHFTHDQTIEGAAATFYGSADGINVNNPTLVEGNYDNALFGNSVSGGDFNGDGYSDIVVGSPFFTYNLAGSGAAFVYNGSETGLIKNDPLILEGDQANSQMGVSVSNAGDVNGDGYTDLIVGASEHSIGFSPDKEGSLFVYHGNGENQIPMQYKLESSISLYEDDLATALSQANINKPTFGIGLNGHSFLGRNRGKLLWETRKEGERFSKASLITNSTKSTGQGPFVSTTLWETELKSIIDKPGFNTKIRARIKYDPTLAITGQVYGPWRYVNRRVLANAAALPVTLISFEAKAMENQAILKWSTSSEVNSDFFELQRSMNGKTWISIGKVLAAENSKEQNVYNFTDTNPNSGSNIYRLKIVDQDGTFAYSNMEPLNFETVVDITFYPNPTQSQLNIASEIPVIELEIYNSAGLKVASIRDPTGIKSVDMSKLPAASYLIKTNEKTFHVIKR